MRPWATSSRPCSRAVPLKRQHELKPLQIRFPQGEATERASGTRAAAAGRSACAWRICPPRTDNPAPAAQSDQDNTVSPARAPWTPSCAVSDAAGPANGNALGAPRTRCWIDLSPVRICMPVAPRAPLPNVRLRRAVHQEPRNSVHRALQSPGQEPPRRRRLDPLLAGRGRWFAFLSTTISGDTGALLRHRGVLRSIYGSHRRIRGGVMLPSWPPPVSPERCCWSRWATGAAN